MSLASDTGKVMQLAVDAWVGALNVMEQRNTELQRQVERLQRALSYWMPCVPGDDAEIALRAGDDAYLLSGYSGPDEPTAEELGWITLRESHGLYIGGPASPELRLPLFGELGSALIPPGAKERLYGPTATGRRADDAEAIIPLVVNRDDGRLSTPGNVSVEVQP